MNYELPYLIGLMVGIGIWEIFIRFGKFHNIGQYVKIIYNIIYLFIICCCFMGRRYYKRYHKSYHKNDDIEGLIRFVSICLSFCLLIILAKYRITLFNFFNQYGITLLIMFILLFVAILIIKKEIKHRKQNNMYKNYNPIQTNPIQTNPIQTNPIQTNNTDINQVELPKYNNDLFVMNNEETKTQNYCYNNYNHVLINQINEANSKTISESENEEESLEQITNINIFLKTAFKEIFSSNEIYSISGYLRWLHPKIFEDLIELIFKIQGYDILKRSTWRGPKGHRKANGDGGIDIICRKDNQTEYIQVKNTVNGFISSGMVRDFDSATVRKRHPGDKVKIITTTLFSDEAIKTANDDGIIMIDYYKLNKIIYAIYNNETHRKILQNFFLDKSSPKEDKYKGDNNECPRCGAPLKLRKEGFYGCQNYYKTGCSYIRKTTTIDVVKNIAYI